MSNNAETVDKKLEAIEKDLAELRSKRKDLLKNKFNIAKVENYSFEGPDGTVTLSELFGDRKDLIVVHNMGKSCPYCTLWADGLSGMYDHFHSRAPFYLVSPDDVATQAEFAKSRNWEFPMLSASGNGFTADMGFYQKVNDQFHYWPGLSTFRKHDDGRIERVSADFFGPGDSYNGLWHMFDLLSEGANNWQPRYSYSEDAA